MARVQDLVSIGFNPMAAKHLGFDVAVGLTATGTTQGTGYAITANFNQFTTVAAGALAATMPLAISSAFGEYVIRNDDSGDGMSLFPGVGDSINALAANTAITIAPGSICTIYRVSDTQWIASTLPNLASGVTGTLPIGNGGTGLTSFDFTTFTPSPTASAGTYTSVTVTYAKYLKIGKLVFIEIAFTGTTSTTPNFLSFTLPFASANQGQLQASGGFVDMATNEIGILSVQDNSTTCVIQRSPASGNFANGAGQGLIANFFYVAAA
jgi:hypothetical protein